MATYDDVWEYFRAMHEPALGRLRHAAALAASPDGKRIVYGGTLHERLEGRSQHRLGILDVATGALRNLDTVPGSASLPAWSPDAASLAYVSDGERLVVGAPSLNLALSGVIEAIAWSADSKRLLACVAGSGADASGAAGSGTVAPNGACASWQPYVETGNARDAWRRAYIVDGVTGRTLWTSPEGDNVWEAVWGDGDAVVAVVSSDPSESAWYRAQLVRYRGTQRDELYRSPQEIGVPGASPDGRYATVVDACCSDRTLVAGNVMLVDLHQPAAPAQPIDTLGVDVTYAVWRDAQRLFFIGLRRMDVVAGEYDVRSSKSRELWRTAESVGADYPIAWPSGSADAFLAVVDSYGRYQRIVCIESGSERVLCELGHDGTDFVAGTGGRAEGVTWKARDGLEIDGVLVLPEREPPYPLVVNVHGGPVFSFRNEWSMHYYYVPIFAHFGYAVLNPNPRGSRGRGQEFARMVRGDMCGEDAYDILLGVEAMIERGIADPERIAVIGRSYGGYMSSWLVTQTRVFAAAIPMSPVTDNFSQHFTTNIAEFNRRFLNDSPFGSNGSYAARSPVFFADRAATPTLSMAGGRDRCTPAGQAMEFHRALTENGVPSELVIYPEEGHHVEGLEARADQMTRMLDWLKRFMPKKPMS
ncbi:MAG: S9 family peptidase [Candidatus Eremiobacteraeota bacterium]|nr:S9 family peptidase [Candidatus Eremiobacteraeota bacterium]